MQLLQRMKIWKEMRRLEQRANDDPSPSTLVDLGQVNINLDMPDKAEQIALDGLRLFPRSTELQDLLACARRGMRKRRLAELRARLIRSPNTALYRELTQLLVEVGDLPGLRQACHEWAVRFPQDAGAWLALARGKLSAFYQDLTARDGAEAMQCLEQAVRLDADAAEAHHLLAEVLYRIGAVRQSLTHLAAIPTADGNHRELQDLHRYVAGLTDHGSDLARLLAEVEQSGALPHPAFTPNRPGSGGDCLAQVREGLAALAGMRGVQKATCISNGKALVKGAIKDGRDPFLKVARVFAKAAHRFSRRLDFGATKKAVVDGPFGHICLCLYGDLLAAVQCSNEGDVEKIMAMLQELVADTLVAAGETP